MGGTCSSLEVKTFVDPLDFTRPPAPRRSSLVDMVDEMAVSTASPQQLGTASPDLHGGGGTSNLSRRRIAGGRNGGGADSRGGSVSSHMPSIGGGSMKSGSRRNPLTGGGGGGGSSHSSHHHHQHLRSGASSMTGSESHQMNSGSSHISSRRQRQHGIFTIPPNHPNQLQRAASSREEGGGARGAGGASGGSGTGAAGSSATDPAIVLFPLGASATSFGAGGSRADPYHQQLTSANNDPHFDPTAKGGTSTRGTRVLSGSSIGSAKMFSPMPVTTTTTTATTTTTTTDGLTDDVSLSISRPGGGEKALKQHALTQSQIAAAAAREHQCSPSTATDGGFASVSTPSGDESRLHHHPLPMVLPVGGLGASTALTADALLFGGAGNAQSTATISSLHQMFEEARSNGHSLLPSFSCQPDDDDDEYDDEYGMM